VFGCLREGCVGVFDVVGVRVSFEVGVSVGYGFPMVCGMRVYGQVQWPIDTWDHVVYVVSGECPCATWLAIVCLRGRFLGSGCVL
jgi:hypothetical protein